MASSLKAKEGTLRYLRSKVVAVVATICLDATPEAATVFYWINDVDEAGFCFYFLSRRNTRKFQNLLANPAVAIVVGTEFEPETVQMSGVAEIIDAGNSLDGLEELKKRLVKHPVQAALYAGAFFPKNPFAAIEGKEFSLYRVRPSWVRHMTVDKKTKHIEYVQILP